MLGRAPTPLIDAAAFEIGPVIYYALPPPHFRFISFLRVEQTA